MSGNPHNHVKHTQGLAHKPEPVTQCFYCGTRSDLGCSHNMNDAYFAMRDKTIVSDIWDKTIRLARDRAGYADIAVLTGPGWAAVNPEPKR